MARRRESGHRLAARKAFIIADLGPADLLWAADAVGDGGKTFSQCRRDRRSAARAGLPRQCVPCRADALDAGRRAGAISGVEAMEALAAGRRFASERQALRRGLRRAATRFGAKIVQERVFEDTGGARRTDSGVTLIQRQMPVLTQNAPAYDVLVAADESEVFAGYLPYRTWDARPVAGSAGLMPDELGRRARSMGRDAVAEPLLAQFAAHERARHAGLDRGAHDRRSRVAHESAIQDRCAAFSRARTFRVAAFKGQKLSLRPWNLQFRQPILLADGRTSYRFRRRRVSASDLGARYSRHRRPETKCKIADEDRAHEAPATHRRLRRPVARRDAASPPSPMSPMRRAIPSR